jgi:hypothetical protein
MLRLLLLLLPLAGLRAESEVSGFNFMDNGLAERMGPENGNLVTTLDELPQQLSLCFSFYVDFDRFSNQVGLFDFRIKTSHKTPKLELVGRFIET